MHAFPASDTLRRYGDFFRAQAHRAGFFTGHAVGAVFLFPMNLRQAETVEPAVDGAERTQVLAEGPEYFYGNKENAQQNSEFPEKESSRLASEQFVGTQEWQSPEKGSGRTEKLAERRNFGKSPEQE